MTKELSLNNLLKNIPALVTQYRISADLRHDRDRLHILIVEDQLFSRRILQQMLHPYFTIDVAEDARTGMRLFLETAPDIVLLDIELAGENGHKLAELIKSVEKESFIVMVTANHSGADVRAARENEVNGYIIKPYNNKKIFEFIYKYWEINPTRKPEGITL